MKPDTILKWYRELVAKKFDGSKNRKTRGRPPTEEEIETEVIRMATDNPGWGLTKLEGELRKIRMKVGRSTIHDILQRNGIPPSTKRRQEVRWKDFIKDHMHNTIAMDFFTVEAFTPEALAT